MCLNGELYPTNIKYFVDTVENLLYNVVNELLERLRIFQITLKGIKP